MKYGHKKWWKIFLTTIAILVITLIVTTLVKSFIVYKNIKTNGVDYTRFANYEVNDEQKKLIEGTEKNYWLGSANPTITIVEFADFACPMCHNSFSKIRELETVYKDHIKFIFRDFPANTEHSVKLAGAARCAGEQGLFWHMHDKLFLNQGISTQEEIITLANKLGLDNDRFKECLITNKYLPEIQKDFSDGEFLGVTGTPTWFINGHKIEGDIPYELFKKIIEELIKIR